VQQSSARVPIAWRLPAHVPVTQPACRSRQSRQCRALPRAGSTPAGRRRARERASVPAHLQPPQQAPPVPLAAPGRWSASRPLEPAGVSRVSCGIATI